MCECGRGCALATMVEGNPITPVGVAGREDRDRYGRRLRSSR
jgi:hypothetical protein